MIKLKKSYFITYNGNRYPSFVLEVGNSRIDIDTCYGTGEMSLYLAGSVRVIVHNSFNLPEDLPKLMEGEKIVSFTGCEYDQEQFSRLVITAVCLKHKEYEMKDLERKILDYSDKYEYMVYVLENNYISNGIRYGYGFRIVSGERQYYAFHGIPERNSGFYVYCEISEAEYKEIIHKYPKNYVSKEEDDVKFFKRYIEHHNTLLSGIDCSPDPVVDEF